MHPVPSHRTVLAISPSDLPSGNQLLVSSCEDCACAVSSQDVGAPKDEVPRDPSSWPDTVGWNPEVARVEIDPENSLLFNPHMEGGRLVLSSWAAQFFSGDERRREIAHLRAAWDGTDSDFSKVVY